MMAVVIDSKSETDGATAGFHKGGLLNIWGPTPIAFEVRGMDYKENPRMVHNSEQPHTIIAQNKQERLSNLLQNDPKPCETRQFMGRTRQQPGTSGEVAERPGFS